MYSTFCEDDADDFDSFAPSHKAGEWPVTVDHSQSHNGFVAVVAKDGSYGFRFNCATMKTVKAWGDTNEARAKTALEFADVHGWL